KTYGVPVATIHFRSHEIPLLELFIYFVQHAVSALGIPSTGVAMLPSRRRLWTVPRSPFIFKKSQENFERITHKRAIKLWDANAQVLGFLERYIAKHEMGGVGVRVVRWER
ncbi:ribosomal protein S10 domain-containing protein, partial [Auriculariales sp. MPI-PUGE-AT-0066]